MNQFRKYLLSSVVFDTPNDKGADKPPVKTRDELIKEERDQARKDIAVSSSSDGDKDDDEKEEKELEAKEEKEEEEKEEDGEGDKEEDKEEDKVEAKEDEVENDPVKLKKTIERLQKRIDKKTGNERDLKKELAEAKEALAAKEAAGDSKLTAEDVKAEAKRIADAQILQRDFERACDALADGATKVDKKFDEKVKILNEEVGPIPGNMIGMLEELDNGGAVLAKIVGDLDLAEELFKLSPGRMSARLAKMDLEIMEAKKPKPKTVSKVAAPNKPLEGSNRGINGTPVETYYGDKKLSDKEAIERRNADVAQKRAAGRIGLR